MKKLSLIAVLCCFVAVVSAQEVKQTFTRKVLVEQFTGASCGWCPSGADRISSAIASNTNVVWVKYHAGYSSDFLTNDIAQSMTIFYGTTTYAPAFMVDRTRFNTLNPAPVMNVGQVADIRSYLAQAKEVATTCKVYTPVLSFDPSTRHLTGTVSGRFGDDSYDESTRLIVFVVEDSLVGTQSDYVNGTQPNYIHMATVRDAITDMWGDPVVVDAGDQNSFSYTIDYTLPSTYSFKNCCIVAIVWQYDPSDVNNCPVLNSAKSDYLDRSLAIGEVGEAYGLRLFPNPAHDQVTVDLSGFPAASGCRIELVDAAGRLCLSETLASAATHTLSLQSLPAGLYLLRVSTPEGVSTRQLLKH